MLEIIDFGEDSLGLFAKVLIRLDDGEKVIRWGFDRLTYLSLKKSIRRLTVLAASSASDSVVKQGRRFRIGLTFECAWNPVERSFVSRVVLTSDGAQMGSTGPRDIHLGEPFRCSKLYAANLQWLGGVKMLRELGMGELDSSESEPQKFEPREPEHIEPASHEVEPHKLAPDAARSKCQGSHERRSRKSAPAVRNLVTSVAATAMVVSGAVLLIHNPSMLATILHRVTSNPGNTVKVSNQFAVLSGDGTFASSSPERDSETMTVRVKGEAASDSASGSTASSALSGQGDNSEEQDKAVKVDAPKKAPGSPQQNATSSSKQQGPDTPPRSTASSSSTQDSIIWSVPKGEVALSFDDGPSPYTLQILDILKKYGVHATFFFVGNRVNWWPQSVTAVAEAGEEVGNHSWSHPEMPKLSQAAQSSQILKTNQTLEKLTGQTVKLFRPPYGEYNSKTGMVASTAGLSVVMWNRDPRDWATKSASVVVHNFFATNPSGGIYDMHENPETLKALPTIIEDLEKKHLIFVTIPSGTSDASNVT